MITVDLGMVCIAAALVYLANQLAKLQLTFHNHQAASTLVDAETDPGKEKGAYDDGPTQEGPMWSYYDADEDPLEMSQKAAAVSRRIL